MLQQPLRHLLIGLEELPVFLLPGKPRHADHLAAQEHQGRGLSFRPGGRVALHQPPPALQPTLRLPNRQLRAQIFLDVVKTSLQMFHKHPPFPIL